MRALEELAAKGRRLFRARVRALGLELGDQMERQELPAGWDHFQPVIYSISTNGNGPQGFSNFFSGLG